VRSRFVPFARWARAPPPTRSGPRRSSAIFGLGHSRHAPTRVVRSARITGRRIAAMRTVAHSWSIPTGRSRTGGGIRRRPPAGQRGGRTRRRTALPIVATSEPRDQRQNQNTSGGVLEGVGDEYAISQRRTPRLTSRLTGDRLTPTDAAASVRRRRACFAARRRGATSGRAVGCQRSGARRRAAPEDNDFPARDPAAAGRYAAARQDGGYFLSTLLALASSF
jgi:hypothetical protein